MDELVVGGWVQGQMDGWRDTWIDERTGRKKDGWMDRWTDRQIKNVSYNKLISNICSSLNIFLHVNYVPGHHI